VKDRSMAINVSLKARIKPGLSPGESGKARQDGCRDGMLRVYRVKWGAKWAVVCRCTDAVLASGWASNLEQAREVGRVERKKWRGV